MQFSGNSMQKRVNSVQRSNKSDILIGQRLTDSQWNASLGCRNIWIRWKFASETMAGVLSRFSFATATTMQQLKNSTNNENTVKRTDFWFSVWKKWCLEKGIAKEIGNYESTQLNTLLEQYYAEVKNKHGSTLQTTIPFHRRWLGHRLNNSLNCLAGLWTFLRLKDVKISLFIFFERAR